MILPLDVFTLIIEELVATIPDLYYPLLDRERRTFGGWPVDDIEAVQEDALKALKATCLTCRVLVPFCQREIFAAVRFESQPVAEEKWRMVAKLDRLLQQSPHLSEYIRKVYFADDSRDHPKSKLISRVLLKLHNVRVFDLDKGCYSSGGNWRQFPDRIAFAIGNYCQATFAESPEDDSPYKIHPSRDHPRYPAVATSDTVLVFVVNVSESHRQYRNRATYSRFLCPKRPPTDKFKTIESADPSIVQPIFGAKTLAVDIASDEDVKFVLKLVKITADLRHLQWFSESFGHLHRTHIHLVITPLVQPEWTFAGLSKVLSTGISQTLTTLTVSVGPLYRGTVNIPIAGLKRNLARTKAKCSSITHIHLPLSSPCCISQSGTIPRESIGQ
jgi:hypothetical protein